LYEHERHPAERNQTTKLPDEAAECLVDVEGRGERAGTAVRRLEQVDAAAELIAKLLGFGRAGVCDGRLMGQPVDQPRDDQACNQEETKRERDAVPEKAGTAELV